MNFILKKNIICPYCFKEFKNTDIWAECRNKHCANEPCDRFNKHWGEETEIGHVFKPVVPWKLLGGYQFNQFECDKCNFPTDRYLCPYCCNQLPIEMAEKGSEIISVIGGPFSGKSNYIITLIEQLYHYGTEIGITVRLQTVGRNESEYTDSLFKSGKKSIYENFTPLIKTDETNNPIPWIVRLESGKTGKAVFLVFYDTAGESFRNAEEITRNASYLAKSKAVIVLFDLLSLPYIENILKENDAMNYDKGTPFEDTMNAILNFKQKDPSIVKKPFAFVMSKFDVILDNKDALGFDISSFTQNSSFITTGKFSLNDVKTSSEAIKSYMREHWDKKTVDYEIEKEWKDKASYFGVSSFGVGINENLMIDVPDGGKIEPFRVMDPLIWILHKLGGFGIPTDIK